MQATSGPLPAPEAAVATPQLTVAAIFKPPILQRLLVGCWVLITINTLIFGFVIFLPQFFLRQGLTITNSLGYTVVLAAASLSAARSALILSDYIGRRWSIIGGSFLTIAAGWVYSHFNAASDPVIVLSVGADSDRRDLYPDGHPLRRLYARTLSDRDPSARERHLQHVGPGSHGGVSFRRRLSDGQLSAAGRGVVDLGLVVDLDYRCLLLGC